MSAQDDDFFGLKSATNLPNISHPQNFLKNKNVQQDIFEENFFPEIAGRETELKALDLDGHAVEGGGDFFEENFTRKADPNKLVKEFDFHFHQQQQPQLNTGYMTADASPFLLSEEREKGIKKLLNLIDPVWEYNSEQLVDFMAQKVIHETDDIIALDKPYQLGYSSAPKNQIQLDRILHMLKKRIAPDIDRLHLISPLDKTCCGIILFAKTQEKQQEFKALLDNGDLYFRFRCICRNLPAIKNTRINIPLIKVIKNGNFKLCPLVGRADNSEQLYHLNTDCKLVNLNQDAHVSLIDAFSRKGLTHVVRSHLYYGLDCPVIGDQKYARADAPNKLVLKATIHTKAMEALDLRKNDLRRLPMFMHLAEVHLPNSRNGTFSVVRAEMPSFFLYALKKLALLRK